ncbi:unnamed protein product [Tilletia controversa]|nr:unnamed protein product [Tilletia controversa]
MNISPLVSLLFLPSVLAHSSRAISTPASLSLGHMLSKDDKPIAASLIDRIRGEEVAKLTKLSSKRLDLSKRYLSQQVRVKAPSECVDASSTAAQERGYGLGWPVARCACMKGYIGARAVAGWMALKRRTALRSSGSDICRAALSSAPNRPD